MSNEDYKLTACRVLDEMHEVESPRSWYDKIEELTDDEFALIQVRKAIQKLILAMDDSDKPALDIDNFSRVTSNLENGYYSRHVRPEAQENIDFFRKLWSDGSPEAGVFKAILGNDLINFHLARHMRNDKPIDLALGGLLQKLRIFLSEYDFSWITDEDLEHIKVCAQKNRTVKKGRQSHRLKIYNPNEKDFTDKNFTAQVIDVDLNEVIRVMTFLKDKKRKKPEGTDYSLN